MDKQSLEFLGNFFLAAAQGQKQLEDMKDWMSGKQSAPSASDEWTAMFRRCFGLGKEEVNSDAWTQAMRQIQTTVSDWLALMNVVPKSEFEALQKENEALKQKIAAQEKVVQQIQDLFSDKGAYLMDAVQEFSRMTSQQSEFFRKLVESIGEVIRTDRDSPKA